MAVLDVVPSVAVMVAAVGYTVGGKASGSGLTRVTVTVRVPMVVSINAVTRGWFELTLNGSIPPVITSEALAPQPSVRVAGESVIAGAGAVPVPGLLFTVTAIVRPVESVTPTEAPSKHAGLVPAGTGKSSISKLPPFVATVVGLTENDPPPPR